MIQTQETFKVLSVCWKKWCCFLMYCREKCEIFQIARAAYILVEKNRNQLKITLIEHKYCSFSLTPIITGVCWIGSRESLKRPFGWSNSFHPLKCFNLCFNISSEANEELLQAENRSFDSSRPGTSLESSCQKSFHSTSLEAKSSFDERRGNPARNYMFKVNNRNTRARCEICLKLAIKNP